MAAAGGVRDLREREAEQRGGGEVGFGCTWGRLPETLMSG